MKKEVEKIFPESKYIYGILFFLRFFAPVLVSPEKYSLVSKKITIEQRRSLILISKILQNTASGVAFDGSKEDYMTQFNKFIQSNQPILKSFFDVLVEEKSILSQEPSKHKSKLLFAKRSEKPKLQESVYNLHSLLIPHQKVFLANLEREKLSYSADPAFSEIINWLAAAKDV